MVCFPVPWFWWSHCFEDWWAIPQPLGQALRRPGLYGKPSGSVLRNVLACKIVDLIKIRGQVFSSEKNSFGSRKHSFQNIPSGRGLRRKVVYLSFVFISFHRLPPRSLLWASTWGKNYFKISVLIQYLLVLNWLHIDLSKYLKVKGLRYGGLKKTFSGTPIWYTNIHIGLHQSGGIRLLVKEMF